VRETVTGLRNRLRVYAITLVPSKTVAGTAFYRLASWRQSTAETAQGLEIENVM